MRKIYILSPKAMYDVDEIGIHSCLHWGLKQAELYIETIKTAFQTAADNTHIGRACDTLRAGYRKYPAGSHIFYYRLLEQSIDIIRILHQNREPRNHM